MTRIIDVTGLSDKQIALVEEIVTALRSVPDNQQINQGGNDDVTVTPEDDELRQLHAEFSWLVADIGVKEVDLRKLPFNFREQLV
ncbi:hypothetical protein [Planktothrix sp. FACHB-1365]|uniref:hypothetical protein n=1 Tax=Planktothrix sp. FACHB-1365 TaxID=2692855 RepID=UPI001682E408|nr:hypothetical protein [Planktothrix sp. FACHB-1365]MBD2481878.1 hypothetical protein [Planktothrix sp. FACHB-1365]